MAAETEHREAGLSEAQGRDSPEEPTEAAAEEAAAGGLRVIQEIIVEPRARALEQALAALDARCAQDLADLREELDLSVRRSDEFIKREAAVLGERLGSERRERIRLVDERARQLGEQLQRLEERVHELEERMDAQGRELRRLILDQYREYSGELRAWRDDMVKAVARGLGELRSEKADRTVLARLLSEVVDRLSGGEAPRVTH